MSKQDIEREYNSFDVTEKEAGKQLFEVWRRFFGQYCAVHNTPYDKLDVKEKIVWTRTAKAVKYAL